MGKALTDEISRQVEQYMLIREHKIFQPNPVPCDGDAPARAVQSLVRPVPSERRARRQPSQSHGVLNPFRTATPIRCGTGLDVLTVSLEACTHFLPPPRVQRAAVLLIIF